MVLKHFILPEIHFKANLFFSHYDPPLTHPTTQPRYYQGGESKRGEWGLMKVKKQVHFKIHFRGFKAFLDHVFFPLRGAGGWVRTLYGKFH